MTSVVIALFVTIYVLARDVTFTQIRLYISKLLKGPVVFHTYTSTHEVSRLGFPPFLHKVHFVLVNCFSLSPMRNLTHTYNNPRPITCVSFRDTMDLVQKFEGLTWDKTVSVSDLELNLTLTLSEIRGSQRNSVPL